MKPRQLKARDKRPARPSRTANILGLTRGTVATDFDPLARARSRTHSRLDSTVDSGTGSETPIETGTAGRTETERFAVHTNSNTHEEAMLNAVAPVEVDGDGVRAILLARDGGASPRAILAGNGHLTTAETNETGTHR